MNAPTLPATSIADEVNDLYNQIWDLGSTPLDKAIQIGELLTNQKATLKHKEWSQWFKHHVRFSERTGQEYMQYYRNRATLKKQGCKHIESARKFLREPSKARGRADLKPAPSAPVREIEATVVETKMSSSEPHKPKCQTGMMDTPEEQARIMRDEFYSQMSQSVAGINKDRQVSHVEMMLEVLGSIKRKLLAVNEPALLPPTLAERIERLTAELSDLQTDLQNVDLQKLNLDTYATFSDFQHAAEETVGLMDNIIDEIEHPKQAKPTAKKPSAPTNCTSYCGVSYAIKKRANGLIYTSIDGKQETWCQSAKTEEEALECVKVQIDRMLEAQPGRGTRLE
jgi:hypothetical protein